MYVAERPASEVLESLGFREEERGMNVWLVIPKDEGVFQGADERDVQPVANQSCIGAIAATSPRLRECGMLAKGVRLG
jgi:hypothetical protein